MPPQLSLRLQNVNPDDEAEMTELVRQRRLCGWGEETIPTWRELIRKGDRLMWWIFNADDDPSLIWDDSKQEEHHILLPDKSNLELPPVNKDFRPIGHIGLDYTDYLAWRNDSSLACRETGTMTIATFFILKSQQGRGWGREAMNLVEKMAKEEHGCKILTLNTIPAWLIRDPGEWEEVLGRPDNITGVINQEWYTRRGYVQYKEMPTYPVTLADGRDVKFPAVVRPLNNRA